MVTPSAFSFAISVKRRSVSDGVSVAVGSSMMSSRARRDSALAISTICFSATINSRTFVSGAFSRPTCARKRAASARIAASSTNQPRFFSWPRYMFCAIVRCSARLNSWWISTMPCASASREPMNCCAWPSTSKVPEVAVS